MKEQIHWNRKKIITGGKTFLYRNEEIGVLIYSSFLIKTGDITCV
jgi:hypothetical protein